MKTATEIRTFFAATGTAATLLLGTVWAPSSAHTANESRRTEVRRGGATEIAVDRAKCGTASSVCLSIGQVVSTSSPPPALADDFNAVAEETFPGTHKMNPEERRVYDTVIRKLFKPI